MSSTPSMTCMMACTPRHSPASRTSTAWLHCHPAHCHPAPHGHPHTASLSFPSMTSSDSKPCLGSSTAMAPCQHTQMHAPPHCPYAHPPVHLPAHLPHLYAHPNVCIACRRQQA